MGMVVSTNVSSLQAQNSLATSQRRIEKSFAQLASGSRITKAADDAAGLSIAASMGSQLRSLKQAQRNAQDGMSMVAVAEGGLNEIGNILVRFRELGVQAASDTVSDQERGFINKEVSQLKSEVQRIAETTRYGTTNLLDGSGKLLEFQVGINNSEFQDRIGFDSGSSVATLDALKISGLDFSSKQGAQGSLMTIDAAQNQVNGYRSNLGALQNRLISTTDNMGSSLENLAAARSRITDADVAESTSELTRNNVLLQASVGVLSQANVLPSQAMKLIG